MDGGAWWAAVHGVAIERLHFHFSLSCIGEVNGNPLQCSCLENPRDHRAWWAAVYGVAQSWTQLRQLSSSSRQIGRKSQVVLVVKNLPAKAGYMRDMGLISAQEDPLEEEMASHSSILAWRIPWTEEPGRL